MLKALRHPGIPAVYDLEEDSCYYYLIEEYLDGESLYACLERDGSLTKAKRISYGIQLCRIIYYLHSFEANPILYLDLQPHNILICHGTLKLIDFDQAVSAGLAGTRKKRCGTRGFAAPEQYTDEPLDVRTDIYAIGALLFYMKAGHAPDAGAEEPGGAGNCRKDFFSGGTISAAETDGLDAIIGRCLRQNRKERYQSVGEICEALQKLQAGAFRENKRPLLKIAVAGSSHGMGATHVSLCAASYLMAQGITSLYAEQNNSGDVRKMAAWQNRGPDSYGIYQLGNQAMRPRYGPNVKLEIPYYDALVEDFGTGLQPVLEEEYDLVLLICGSREWELGESVSSVRSLARKRNLRILFNHISPEERLILPGDVTSFHLFRLPFLALSGEDTVCRAFWDAVFAGTDAGKMLKERKEESLTAERRPGLWAFLKDCAAGLRNRKHTRNPESWNESA